MRTRQQIPRTGLFVLVAVVRGAIVDPALHRSTLGISESPVRREQFGGS